MRTPKHAGGRISSGNLIKSLSPGGLVEKSLKRVRAEKPVRLIEDAIAGMLPKTKLGKQMYRKLKVYAGDKHPHAAQQPVALAVK